jgi:hypothetical protein
MVKKHVLTDAPRLQPLGNAKSKRPLIDTVAANSLSRLTTHSRLCWCGVCVFVCATAYYVILMHASSVICGGPRGLNRRLWCMRPRERRRHYALCMRACIMHSRSTLAGGRARIDSKSLCWRRTMRVAVGRFVCRSRSILNYLPLARLPAWRHLSLIVYLHPTQPIYPICVCGHTHLDLHAMRLLREQLSPRPKHSNSAAPSRSPLAPHQISIAYFEYTVHVNNI